MLKGLMDKCAGFNIERERRVSEEYVEIVIFTADIAKWSDVFASEFGAPTKPAGIAPTSEHQELTADFGGISAGQILFSKKSGDDVVIIMFWPWQDGMHTTLKMVLLKN
ncbi:MAG: hypothetical protein ABII88_08070 [Candidatus Omnitrophota bacterium]